MNKRKYIVQFLGVVALTLVLLVPTMVQFSHLFEAHEHEVCYEQTTHLHEDEADCHVCDFYGQSFHYTLNEETFETIRVASVLKETDYTSLVVSSNKYSSKQLRGPPSFLS